MECVFFLFPGRVLVVLLCLTGIRTDKKPTGQSPLSILEPSTVILNFALKCQYFFLTLFEGAGRLSARKMEARAPASPGWVRRYETFVRRRRSSALQKARESRRRLLFALRTSFR